MRAPLLTARGLTIAAAGALAAFAALAATATLTPVAADSSRAAHPMQGHDMTTMDHSGAFWFGAPGKATDVDRTIGVRANDISFDPPALQVRAGETVRFIVTNASDVEHEFTLGDARTQGEHRAEMAAMTDMEASHAHGDDANAVFLKGGETREIVWRFAKAGQIEFACNVPGHYESGMKGTIAIL
jgi:uncharacterized cupredoxin-like copper-binding protein